MSSSIEQNTKFVKMEIADLDLSKYRSKITIMVKIVGIIIALIFATVLVTKITRLEVKLENVDYRTKGMILKAISRKFTLSKSVNLKISLNFPKFP